MGGLVPREAFRMPFLCLGVVMVALEGHVSFSTTAARNWRLLWGILKYRLQVLFLANTALIREVGGCGGHRRFPMNGDVQRGLPR